MGKTRDWLCVVKKAFSHDSKKNKEPSKSKKKWVGNSKNSGSAVSLPGQEHETPKPLPTPTEPANLTQAQNEHKKHAYSVALVTSMAAAAAVVEAREAADGVHVPSAQGNSPGKDVEDVHTDSVQRKSSGKTAAEAVLAASLQSKSSEKITAAGAVHFASLQRKSLEKKAAIKIQTAFRSYLAKKEVGRLRRLESYIQGQSMKQATTTLRCMQTLARVQSQIRARRLRMSEENRMLQQQLQKKHNKEVEEKNASVGSNWRGSKISKEQSEAIKQNRQQAAKKRERALAYAFTHQRPWKVPSKALNQTLMDQQNPLWGWSWFERWMEARPWEMTTSTPNNVAAHATVTASPIYKNDNNKSSPTPSKPSSRPNARPSILTPRSKIPSVSLVSSKIRQPSSSVTHRGGDETPTLDRQQRRPSTAVGIQSVRDDESLGVTRVAAPNSRTTPTPTRITNTRPSQSVNSSGLGVTPQMGLASTAKKRLSFPQKASNSMKQSGPPMADNTTAAKHTGKKEGKLRNGVVGSGGGKVV